MGAEARDPEASSAGDFARWWEETGEHELRQVLFWRWDPLGVADLFPGTADEYDDYAPQVAAALRDGDDEEAVARLLHGIEHDAMGVGGADPGHLVEVAQFLVEWYEASRARWSEFGPLRR